MQRDNLFAFLWDILRRNPLVGICLALGMALGGVLALTVFFREPATISHVPPAR